MNGAPVFQPRTVFWLVVVGSLSFAAALVVMVLGQDIGTTAKANSFSTSAIGHRAFVETLDRLGFRVLVSRHNSAEKAGEEGLLVLAEPIPGESGVTDLLGAPNLLYVLPKRTGKPDPDNPRWLLETAIVPLPVVEASLDRILSGAQVVRPKTSPAWRSGAPGLEPEIAQPQLVRSERLSPFVGSDQGVLLGGLQTGSGTLWVLSDPDLLANHGIGLGDNAALLVRALEHMNPAGGLIVVDETIHGFTQPPSLWRSLFAFPFVVVTVQAVATLVVLMLAATERFGAPLPLPRVLPEGKAALLANTADLLSLGGHGRDLLRRYARVTLRDVARRLQLPAGLTRDEMIARLDRIAEARGIGDRFAEIDALVGASALRFGDGGRILQAAGRLFRWKREMLNGSVGGSRG